MTADLDLPNGWRLVRLGDVCLPTPRRNPRNEGPGTFLYVDIDAVDNDRQEIISPKCIQNAEAPSRARHEIRTGDVIFSLVRPYLRNIATVTSDYDCQVASSAFCVLRPSRELTTGFLFHLVSSTPFIASIPTYGHSPPAGRDNELLDVRIPLPPIEEQRRIVTSLEQVLARLRAGQESVMRSVRGLDRYSMGYLQAIFSPLQGRPRESAFAFVTSGSRGWARYYSQAGASFIRMGNLQRGQLALDLTSVQSVDPPRAAEGTRTRLNPGDLLISITADLGMVGIVPENLGEAYVNQHIALARGTASFDPRYLGWFLASSLGQRELTRLGRGATKVGLGLDDIRSVVAPAIALDEQLSVVEAIDRHDSVRESVRRQLESLTVRAVGLRDATLRAAFAGHL